MDKDLQNEEIKELEKNIDELEEKVAEENENLLGGNPVDISIQNVVDRQERHKPREYDREKYDDEKKRKKFKEDQFGDKKTVKDPYSNDTLHKDSDAAGKKYGEKNKTKHTVDVDHTVPLKQIHEKVKYNPFITAEDEKRIANNDANYQLISSKSNRSKGSKSNSETAKDNNYNEEQTKRMQQAEKEAKKVINKEIAKTTVKNAGKYAAKSAAKGFAASALSSATRNAVDVINGDITVDEAVENITKDSAKGGLTVAAENVSVEVGVAQLHKAADKLAEKAVDKETSKAVAKMATKGSKALNKIADSNKIGDAIVAIKTVGPILKDYYNGNISTAEMLDSLGEEGTKYIAGKCGELAGAAVGGAVFGVIAGALTGGVGTLAGEKVGEFIGGVIGDTIGSMIGSVIYKAFHSAFSDEEIKRRRELREAYERMGKMLDEYYENLKIELERERIERHDELLSSFLNMREAINSDDDELFTSSLERVCLVYNTELAFKTNEEFVDFWNDDTKVMKLS